jgi:pimeloyl-ACP methyl ester carboxylesterase
VDRGTGAARLTAVPPHTPAAAPGDADACALPEAGGGQADGPGQAPGDAPLVLLLHGLGRTARSMAPLARRLRAAGFRVESLGYAWRRNAPDALVDELVREIAARAPGAPRVHFVTHSLGGLLLRAALARYTPPNLGRVVMLAPPNRGSELVDALAGSALFRWAVGPTALQLGTGPDSLPLRLPPCGFELGVIAGTARVNPLGAALIPGASDGTVSVASARLEGMADFLEVPHSHPFIMRPARVAQQVIHFLREGRFAR